MSLTPEEEKELEALKAKKVLATPIEEVAAQVRANLALISQGENTSEEKQQESFSIWSVIPATDVDNAYNAKMFVMHVFKYLFPRELKAVLKSLLVNFMQDVKPSPLTYAYKDILQEVANYAKTHSDKETKVFIKEIANEMMAYDNSYLQEIKDLPTHL